MIGSTAGAIERMVKILTKPFKSLERLSCHDDKVCLHGNRVLEFSNRIITIAIARAGNRT